MHKLIEYPKRVTRLNKSLETYAGSVESALFQWRFNLGCSRQIMAPIWPRLLCMHANHWPRFVRQAPRRTMPG
jgi:hypothetical protein